MHLGVFASMRFFHLSDGNVQCGAEGLFVGSVPMLTRSLRAGDGEFWAVRPIDELDRELGACYGLPIDAASKREGLAGVARALERGEMALAKISAVLLGFPDPPPLTKGAPESGSPELIAQLFWSGLLKGDWDSTKHPRTGDGPNRGWFAPKPTSEQEPDPEKPPRDLRQALMRPVRYLLRGGAVVVVENLEAIQWTVSRVKDDIEAIILFVELNYEISRIMRREVEEMRASLDPPKTLVELQTPPTANVLGYDVHHIVEQNPDNILKSPVEVDVEKFGRNLIDSPSNLVWIPRLKHEMITAYYNSKVSDDGPLRRQIVNAGDFETQRAAGLAALRQFGVLK
jgi:hypothetical protein